MQIKTSFLIFFALIRFASIMGNTLFAQLALPTVSSDESLGLSTVLIINKIAASFPKLETLILLKDAPKGAQENYVYNQYGFMCKQEAKRDKQTKILVRMRLESLDAVNTKEYGN